MGYKPLDKDKKPPLRTSFSPYVVFFSKLGRGEGWHPGRAFFVTNWPEWGGGLSTGAGFFFVHCGEFLHPVIGLWTLYEMRVLGPDAMGCL